MPTAADLARLDPRFRLAPGVLGALPGAGDVGFAVFQLRAAPTGAEVHPMALAFPRRDPRQLFFPTVHVHDGTVPREAAFDHTLYAQPTDRLAAVMAWERADPLATLGLPTEVDVVVDRARPLLRRGLFGVLPNRDVVLEAPGVDPAALDLRGPHHRMRLRVGAAWEPAGHGSARWRQLVHRRLDAVVALASSLLATAIDPQREAWRLIAWDDALPSRPHHTPANRPNPPGPCRVALWHGSGEVEHQCLEVAFADPPPLKVVQAMHAVLRAVVEELGKVPLR